MLCQGGYKLNFLPAYQHASNLKESWEENNLNHEGAVREDEKGARQITFCGREIFHVAYTESFY